MLNKKVAIIGYSGHGLVVSEAAIEQGLNLNFYIEKSEVEKNLFELQYLGDENDMRSKAWLVPDYYILGIGNNSIRSKVVDRFLKKKKKIINVLHPKANISSNASLGNGCFISKGVSINVGSEIGNYAILNTGCVIEHECNINDFVHIAPGAVLAGNVSIGSGSFVGANSVIKQGVSIGKNVIIGAGSVIINNVPDGVVVVGNPGKILKR